MSFFSEGLQGRMRRLRRIPGRAGLMVEKRWQGPPVPAGAASWPVRLVVAVFLDLVGETVHRSDLVCFAGHIGLTQEFAWRGHGRKVQNAFAAPFNGKITEAENAPDNPLVEVCPFD